MTDHTWRRLPRRPRAKDQRAAERDPIAPVRYLAERCARGTAYTLDARGTRGRAVIDEGCVVNWSAPAWTWPSLLATSGATRALCRDRDRATLEAARVLPHRDRLAAYLYESAGARVRLVPRGVPAHAQDLPEILALHPGFFAGKAELRAYLAHGAVRLYRRAGSLLGCGIAGPADRGSDAWDVGMVVARGARGRGLGTRIAREMRALCEALGHAPVACCDRANVASRRALERAGFRRSGTLRMFRFLV